MDLMPYFLIFLMCILIIVIVATFILAFNDTENSSDDLEFVCADHNKGVWLYGGRAFELMTETDYAKFCGND